MEMFKKQDKEMDSLYTVACIGGRINYLLYNCYEYGKLSPKKGKTDTCKLLKELSKKNREDLSFLINKRKRTLF